MSKAEKKEALNRVFKLLDMFYVEIPGDQEETMDEILAALRDVETMLREL